MSSLEYRIEGSDLQFVEIMLSPGETLVGEPGAMMYQDEGVTMDTRLGDGVDESFLARLTGGIKRAFTGERMFSTLFENATSRPLRVAFATPTLGKILPVDLAANGGAIICQKGSFLAGTQGVRVSLAFKKRLRVGFFGGEGFIMQKLTGEGTAFINASGTLQEIYLAPGQALKVDTGCLAALQTTASYDIRYVGKLKTSFFGGEGLFFAHLKGPGTVWLQSLPVKRLLSALASGRPRRGVIARLLYFFLVIFFVLVAIFSEQGIP